MVFQLLVHLIEKDNFGASILQRKILYDGEKSNNHETFLDLPQ